MHKKRFPYGRGSVTRETGTLFLNRDRKEAFAANTKDIALLTRRDKTATVKRSGGDPLTALRCL